MRAFGTILRNCSGGQCSHWQTLFATFQTHTADSPENGKRRHTQRCSSAHAAPKQAKVAAPSRQVKGVARWPRRFQHRDIGADAPLWHRLGEERRSRLAAGEEEVRHGGHHEAARGWPREQDEHKHSGVLGDVAKLLQCGRSTGETEVWQASLRGAAQRQRKLKRSWACATDAAATFALTLVRLGRSARPARHLVIHATIDLLGMAAKTVARWVD